MYYITADQLYVCKCPDCNSQVFILRHKKSNTSQIELYSDFKKVCPNADVFTNIGICSKCGCVFKITENQSFDSKGHTEIGYCQEQFEHFKGSDLYLYAYFDALYMKFPNTKEEELIIRKSIMWVFNDRVRNGKRLFEQDIDKYLWQENLYKLKDILETKDIEDKFLLADIDRSLGDFDSCIFLINSIEIEEFDWLKDLFKYQCIEKNKKVFQINSNSKNMSNFFGCLK